MLAVGGRSAGPEAKVGVAFLSRMRLFWLPRRWTRRGAVVLAVPSPWAAVAIGLAPNCASSGPRRFCAGFFFFRSAVLAWLVVASLTRLADVQVLVGRYAVLSADSQPSQGRAAVLAEPSRPVVQAQVERQICVVGHVWRCVAGSSLGVDGTSVAVAGNQQDREELKCVGQRKLFGQY